MIDTILRAFPTPEINIQEQDQEHQMSNRVGKLLNYFLTKATFLKGFQTIVVQQGIIYLPNIMRQEYPLAITMGLGEKQSTVLQAVSSRNENEYLMDFFKGWTGTEQARPKKNLRISSHRYVKFEIH